MYIEASQVGAPPPTSILLGVGGKKTLPTGSKEISASFPYVTKSNMRALHVQNDSALVRFT